MQDAARGCIYICARPLHTSPPHNKTTLQTDGAVVCRRTQWQLSSTGLSSAGWQNARTPTLYTSTMTHNTGSSPRECLMTTCRRTTCSCVHHATGPQALPAGSFMMQQTYGMSRWAGRLATHASNTNSKPQRCSKDAKRHRRAITTQRRRGSRS